MNITFAPNNVLQIDNAKITYQNFRGEKGPYNRDGKRSFALIIDNEQIAEELIARGWNVRIKPPTEKYPEPFMYMTVKVNYDSYNPPIVYLTSGRNMVKLDEDTVGSIDFIKYENIDLDINPHDWEMNGETGRSAFLRSMHVIQRIDDRFAERYDEQY